jgi:hypothetical protein
LFWISWHAWKPLYFSCISYALVDRYNSTTMKNIPLLSHCVATLQPCWLLALLMWRDGVCWSWITIYSLILVTPY